MVLDANGHLLETTVSKRLNSGCRVKCNLSIPSKGSVEPAYGESGPGNATAVILPQRVPVCLEQTPLAKTDWTQNCQAAARCPRRSIAAAFGLNPPVCTMGTSCSFE